jgi:hypothetical protein
MAVLALLRQQWMAAGAFANGYLGFMSPFVWMFISSYGHL